MKNFNPLSKFAAIYIDVIGNSGCSATYDISKYSFVGYLRETPILLVGRCLWYELEAYVAEIIRAGIEGLDKGQMEAGRALGLSYAVMEKIIIIPQAIKILPALVSEFITLLKETSIIGFIGGIDLLRSANIGYLTDI